MLPSKKQPLESGRRKKKMEKLKMRMETNEEGRVNPIFTSEDKEAIINWTITALFDGIVKRCKLKINQYYVDSIEYCNIKATYKRLDPEYKEIKETYIIENWRNDWGNFINVYKTFKDNNITIDGSEK